MKMATARQVMARHDLTTMTMATGDKVNDDGDGVMDDGAMGDDDDDACNG